MEQGEVFDNFLIPQCTTTPKKWLLKHRPHDKRIGYLKTDERPSRRFVMISCSCGEFFLMDELCRGDYRKGEDA